VPGVQAEAEDASNDDQTSANRIKLTIRSLLVRNLVALLVDTGLQNIVRDIVLALSRNIHHVQRQQVARDLGEGDVEVHCDLLASRLVHDHRRVVVDSPVVDEFERCKCEDNRERNDCH